MPISERLEKIGWLQAIVGATVVCGALFIVVGFVFPVLDILLPLGLALLVGSLISAVWLVSKWAWHHLARLRRKRIIESVFQNHPASVAIVDGRNRTLFRNPRFREGYHLNNGDSLMDALQSLGNDPVGDMHKLHQMCDLNGHAKEVMRRGTLSLDVCVQSVGQSLYLWQISDRIRDRAMPEHADIPLVEYGSNGTIFSVNDHFQRRFRAQPKTLSGISISIDTARGGPLTIETDNGSETFMAQHTPVLGGRGAMFLFPTDSLGKQNPLQENEVFEHIPVPLMRLTLEGKILAINANARSALRHGVVQGQTIKDVFVATTRTVEDWLANAQSQVDPSSPEILRLSEKGDELILQANLTRFEEGDDSFFICNLSDVTELKSLEAQFVQSQKMQAIGQLAGGVAHDFNNLLTAISGHCDLLLLRHDKEDPDHADLMQIHQNANRAGSLVGQLLAFSRKQKLQFQSLNMRDTLADLGHLLNRLVGEKVRLNLIHGKDLNPVRADKRQLEQVLMNLVVNARDAMPDGGTVDITTKQLSYTRPKERETVIIPPGEYVKILVTDQGSGIRADLKAKIFEPFFTTKKTGEGTGLGLSTVYGIIKQSGGFIFVSSEMGKGTTFEVLLPAPALKATQPDPVVETAAPMVPEKSEGIVLLVEDEAPVRAFASRALQLKGFQVMEADCAEAALAILEDETLHFDAFVTDVVMPGMDGPTWVAKAHETRPNVQVVFVSGYAEDSLEGNEETFKNAAFLPKPFSLTDLTTTVQSVIG